MGRNAKSAKLHLLEGNKNRLTKEQLEKRLEEEEKLQPRDENIDPPKWLDAAAKKEFRRVAELLKEIKLVTEADIALLAAYADSYSEYVKCTRQIRKDGIMIDHVNTTGKINKIVHPLSSKKTTLFNQMKAVASEMGLSPNSRAKLAIPKKGKKEETEFEKLFGDV